MFRGVGDGFGRRVTASLGAIRRDEAGANPGSTSATNASKLVVTRGGIGSLGSSLLSTSPVCSAGAVMRLYQLAWASTNTDRRVGEKCHKEFSATRAQHVRRSLSAQ